MPSSSATIPPNLGLYLGMSPLSIPARGLQDGMNFRIKEGKLTNRNIGWDDFSAITFNGPIMVKDVFNIRGLSERDIVITPTDIYSYDRDNDTAVFITPRYATGTVNVSAAANAVVTVASGVPNWVTNGILEGMQISFGDAAENDPAATWYTIDTVNGESQLTLDGAVAGAPLAGVAYTIRRTFTGNTTNIWDTEVFVAPDDGTGDDLWFATNGLDRMVSWDGSASQVTILDGLGFTAKRIKVYKNMMLYGNLLMENGDFLPTSIINSDIGKPINAGDAGTGVSEQFRAHEGVDHINELEDLGDNLVIYSERHLTLMQFVGDPLIFIFREAASGVGLIGSRLIADFGDYHEFIGHDSQYLFDGVAVTEIGKQIWREILRLRDPTRHHLGWSHFDEGEGELIWAVCLTSDVGVGDNTQGPEEAFVEHYLEEVGDRVPTPYSRRAMPFLAPGYGTQAGVLTWDELSETWEELAIRWNDTQLFDAFPINVMGTEGGQLFTLNLTQTDDAGNLLVSFVRSGRRLLGDGRMRGLLARIYPFATQLVGFLTCTLRLCDHAAGEISTIDQQSFDMTLPAERHFVSPYRRGRYFELEFGTPGHAWELSGWDIDVKPGGMR